MAFGDNALNRGNAGGTPAQSESIYFKLTGEQTIRILDKTETVFTYWRYYMPVNVDGKMQDRSIVVDRGGPIASFMAEIGKEDRRYRGVQKRVMSNIFDRATKKVYVLDYGNDLLTKISALHQRVRKYGTMDSMNVWDFDIDIRSVEGKEKKDVRRDVIPGMDQEPLAPEYAALPIFDFRQVIRPMPVEAQARLLAGDDLLEILKELNWPKPTPTVSQ